MQNLKLFTLFLAVTILTLTATACDAATLEQLQAAGITTADDGIDSNESKSTARDGASKTELKAIITDVTSTSITFGGVTYIVDTVQDLTALLTPGQGYELEFFVNPDGSITLLRFDLEDSLEDSDDDGDVEVKVLVTEVTANTITFNGVTYTVNTTDDLTTLFTAGLGYEIEYIQNLDGTITLLDFHFEDDLGEDDLSDDDDGDVEVKVLVTEVTTNTITFNGMTYTVNTTADLTTLFTAGLGYEIEYLLNPDGTITLLDFHFEDDLSDDDGDEMDDDMDDDDNDNNNDIDDNNFDNNNNNNDNINNDN